MKHLSNRIGSYKKKKEALREQKNILLGIKNITQIKSLI